jgi:hypothetical protein
MLPVDILELGERSITTPPNVEILSPSSAFGTPSVSSVLTQQLLDLADQDPAIRSLLWDPWALHATSYDRPISSDTLLAFREQLVNWATTHDVFSQFGSLTLQGNLSNCDWSKVDNLQLPPPPYTVPSPLCLVACLHSFYMSRICWALSIIDHDRMATTFELYSYFYSYEVMRCISTINNGTIGVVNEKGEGYLPCESVRFGFVPMLHIIGQCCPRPLWLQYLMGQLSWLGREGIFDGRVLARSLNALYTFEMSNNLDSSSLLDRFPPPASRIVTVLLPELGGQSYVAFYAAPDNSDPKVTHRRYYPVGHARWVHVRRVGNSKPDIEMYNDQRKFAAPFSREWLSTLQVVQDWIAWANQTGFNLDRALRDHISGSCLEKAIYEPTSSPWYSQAS